jgi:hypothetical protein
MADQLILWAAYRAPERQGAKELCAALIDAGIAFTCDTVDDACLIRVASAAYDAAAQVAEPIERRVQAINNRRIGE